MMGGMPLDDPRTPDHLVGTGRSAPRRVTSRSRGGARGRALLLLAILAGGSAGCAGMPPPQPPPPPAPASQGDGYSGGSNFGGPPMDFGPQE
jgi:hypothetical protein